MRKGFFLETSRQIISFLATLADHILNFNEIQGKAFNS